MPIALLMLAMTGRHTGATAGGNMPRGIGGFAVPIKEKQDAIASSGEHGEHFVAKYSPLSSGSH
jgi:hypothetical protein